MQGKTAIAKPVYSIVLAAVLSLGTACSTKSKEMSAFVGQWVGPDMMSRTEFFADGTFSQVVPGTNNAGTWEIVQEGQAKYLKMDFKIVVQMYQVGQISDTFIDLREGSTPRSLRRLRMRPKK